MSKKWQARWPIPIFDATEPASTLAAVLCVIIRVRRSCDTDCWPPLMRAWDSVTAWEHGERQSDRSGDRTLQQDVVRHMKVTRRATGVPTAHWLVNYTSYTVVLPCRAFYDRLARTVCLCPVALSCSHCDVVNLTLQIRHIGRRSAVPFHLQCVKLPPMCRCWRSDIIIGLTLLVFVVLSCTVCHAFQHLSQPVRFFF